MSRLITAILCSFLFLPACQSDESEDIDKQDQEVDLNTSFEALQNELIEPVWGVETDGEYFEIEIPKQMREEDSLNVEASLQYAYVEKVEGEVKENYIIVLVHDKKQLKTSSKAEYTVASYNQLSVENLMEGKQSYEVLEKTDKIEINGREAVVNEIKSGIQMKNGNILDVFYMLAVIEGEKAFYQILSWTLMNQKSDFKADMKRMIYSFKEI
ncbi:MAG: hypothetical protein WDZ35_11375 [Crocinitomicaceae bacterium]